MLALRSNKDPKLQYSTSLLSPHFTDAVTEAPRVSWLAQDHVAGWHQPRLPGHLGQACWAPLGVSPPWRSCPDIQERNSGECLRGCGLYGREAHGLLAPRLQEPQTLWVDGPPFLPPVLGWGGRSCRSSAARSVSTYCVLSGTLVLPQPRGCLHFSMAPGPHPASGSRPYSLLTTWAGTGALPSRPVWDNGAGSP